MFPIYILGCGGHARSVVDVLQANQEKQEIILVDKNANQGELILDCTVIKQLPLNMQYYHVAFGSNSIRSSFFSNTLTTIVSHDAYLSRSAIIQSGSFVGHRVHVGPEAQIGKGVILNTSSILEHQTFVGDFCHVSVNATLCGKVRIGSLVFIGAGSTIIDGISVTDNVIIGAGSVVVKDIVESGVYVGCPAKRIK